MDVRSVCWQFAGLLILAVGTGISDVHMFRGRVPVVMAGIVLVVAGYQLIHYGSHGDGLVRRLSNHEFGENDRETATDWLRTVGLLTLGVYLVAQGFVFGAQAAVGAFSIAETLACGPSIVAGYVVGHYGVHGEYL